MSQWTKTTAIDSAHRATFDRDTRYVTLTAHGAGHDLLYWGEVGEPTHKQLEWVGEQASWGCCAKRP